MLLPVQVQNIVRLYIERVRNSAVKRQTKALPNNEQKRQKAYVALRTKFNLEIFCLCNANRERDFKASASEVELRSLVVMYVRECCPKAESIIGT